MDQGIAVRYKKCQRISQIQNHFLLSMEAEYADPRNRLEESIKRLNRLNFLLESNRQIQLSLKKARDSINNRMTIIDQYISTYRLKSEYPIASPLVSFIKFERNIPKHLLEQTKIVDTEVFRGIEDEEFINMLGEESKQRKKQSTRSQKKTVDFSLLSQQSFEINFKQQAAMNGYSSGIEFYRDWSSYNKQKNNNKIPFSLEEQRIILEMRKKYGNCWQKMGQFLPIRCFDDIYYEFHNRINPRNQSGRWTYNQSLRMLILLQKFGSGNWAAIGDKMQIKSELQVRQRYCNIMNPRIGKDDNWTPEMEEALMEVALQEDFSWNRIAKIPIFQNKTDNCIWRKFRSLLLPYTKEEILEIIPKEFHKLAYKIIKYKEVYDARTRRPVDRSGKFDPNAQARSNREMLSQNDLRSIVSIRTSRKQSIQDSKVEEDGSYRQFSSCLDLK